MSTALAPKTTFQVQEQEVTRSFTLSFPEPVFARHPQYADAVLAFTEATLTLSAELTGELWSTQRQLYTAEQESDGVWRSKRKLGASPTLELDAPDARLVKDGQVTARRAFLGDVTPVPLSKLLSVELQEELKRTLVEPFWAELETAR